MKSQRRHELQTNTLADLVGHGLQRYREHLPTIGLAVVAIAAALVLVSIWGSQRSGTLAEAWRDYDAASYAKSYSEVADRLNQVTTKYPNTPVALWARLDLADVYSFEGKNKLETDRENGVARLREARRIYADVLASPKLVPEMIRRAALSEAKCWELMGERGKAIEAYYAVQQKYERNYPEMAKDAASRASDLEQTDAAEFYAWLATYKPIPAKPLTSPSLDPLLPPERDSQDAPESMPDLPDAKEDSKTHEPNSPDDAKPGTSESGEPASETTPADKPAEKPEADQSAPTGKKPTRGEEAESSP